jgi:HEPN domain-containing protein
MSVEEHLSRSRQWFEAAWNDLEAARLLMNGKIYNTACFMAQQAAEKSFKGLIVATGKTYPRSHSLGSLMGELPENVDLSALEPGRLDRYYIAPRYPESLPPEGSIVQSYGLRDAQDAINTAEGVVQIMSQWAQQCGVRMPWLDKTTNDAVRYAGPETAADQAHDARTDDAGPK